MNEKLNVRIDDKMMEKLRQLAYEKKISMSRLLRLIIASYLLNGCVTTRSIGNNQHVISYQGNNYSTASAASDITFREASKICLNFEVVSSDSSFDSRGKHNVTTVIRCNP